MTLMKPIKYLVNLARKLTRRDAGKFAAAPIELIAARRYQPVGQCIYCRATQVPLTDEHVVPYGLNGNWVLPKASCQNCAVITGRIEQEILRGELRHLRTALHFQTRRRGERPPTVRLRADNRDVEIPISDCPIIMPFIRFPVAGLLENRPSKNGIDVIGQVGVRWGPDPQEFADQRGYHQLSFGKTIAPPIFARMIAKIGYAHAVARFGLEAFRNDLVTDVILGRSQRIGDVVGCVQQDFPVFHNPNDHVLQPVIYKGGLSGDDRLLAIRVKLFAGCPTPVYEVIAGRAADWMEDLRPDYHCD